MRYTNKYNLPETIVRALHRKNAEYSKGPAHRSCTQLIVPPRIDLLRKKHFAEMVKDVSDEWWSLLGSAVHHILELGANDFQVAEERLYVEVDGWVISGALDCQTHVDETGIHVEDYKVTAAYNVTKGQEDDEAKREWVEQMNIQAYLVETSKKMKVNDISIIAIIRDWQRKKAAYDSSYPQSPIVRYPLPLWPMEEREKFILERILIHRNAEMNAALGLPLPDCTPYERWERGSSFAVTKSGAKRATAVFNTEEEATADLAGRGAGYEIVHRPGQSVRCDHCGVSEWCDQYARMKDGVQN